MNPIHTAECFHNHMGVWMIEEIYGRQMLEGIRAGLIKPRAYKDDTPTAEQQEKSMYSVNQSNGIAVISIEGPLQKAWSKYGGTSTVSARKVIRQAASDTQVAGIMLRIDSPGGTAAGTKELADEIASANRMKPVHAYGEDLVASAAYWAASQARKIVANAPAQIGSIGTMLGIYDMSKAAEMQGIKVHVLKTGTYKGSGTPGTEISSEQLAYFQTIVDDLNQLFTSAVKKGRDIRSEESFKAVSDGRVHISQKAKEMRLIDEIGSFESAMAGLEKEIKGISKLNSLRQTVAKWPTED